MTRTIEEWMENDRIRRAENRVKYDRWRAKFEQDVEAIVGTCTLEEIARQIADRMPAKPTLFRFDCKVSWVLVEALRRKVGGAPTAEEER